MAPLLHVTVTNLSVKTFGLGTVLPKAQKNSTTLQTEDAMYEIYTDGSCDNSVTKSGSSAFVILKDNTVITDEVTFYENTTSNRNEYQAAINALKFLRDEFGSSTYVLRTDSQILANTANTWIWKWCNNKWKRGVNGEIKNLDLIKELHKLLLFHSGSFEWIKGHAGNEWNEYCDGLCRDNDIKYLVERGINEFTTEECNIEYTPNLLFGKRT